MLKFGLRIGLPLAVVTNAEVVRTMPTCIPQTERCYVSMLPILQCSAVEAFDSKLKLERYNVVRLPIPANQAGPCLPSRQKRLPSTKV
jgi:hypothetical protein